MFQLKSSIEESAFVEFKHGKGRIRKSVEWVRSNQAEAICKYRLEYLFQIPDRRILEEFIKEVERRIYPKGHPQHPDSQNYEMRHIREFKGNVFADLDIDFKAIEAKVSGDKVQAPAAPQEPKAPKPPKASGTNK